MATTKVKLTISIETSKSHEEVISALKRGIYRGLDTEPYYVASPKDVDIEVNLCRTEMNK